MFLFTCCEKDYDDTGNMGDGSKDEEHQEGSSMEDDGTKEEDHEDGSSVEDDGSKEEDHEDGSSVEDDGTKEEDHEDGGSMEDDGTNEEDHEEFGSLEDDGTKEENYEDGGSMIDDDDNADDTSVNKEEANENGGRDVKEHTDMKRNPNKINSCLDAEIDVIAKEYANAKLLASLAHHFAKTTMKMPVLCKVTELFIHCHTCMYMQLILICSNCIWSSFPILLSNTIQACRIIFIRNCGRCINTASNLGNHCNNFTSHLVKHTPNINLINAQITCIICMPHV